MDRAGHYNRALEEAISSHKSQWARDWATKNPLAGGATFSSMTPVQRVWDYYSQLDMILANRLCSSSSPFSEPSFSGP
jgi:hypothetical protein